MYIVLQCLIANDLVWTLQVIFFIGTLSDFIKQCVMSWVLAVDIFRYYINRMC